MTEMVLMLDMLEFMIGTEVHGHKGDKILMEKMLVITVGNSVSISSDGNTAAIGAPKATTANSYQSGHVRIYEWNGGSWTQRGQDIDGEAAGDYSGRSVSLSSDGNTVAIGAVYNDGNGADAGHVRIYDWNGSSWTQRGQDIDGENLYDYRRKFCVT